MAHVPVLLNSCIENLNIVPGGVFVDGTLGGAGHALEIAKRIGVGRLIAIDRDESAIKRAEEKLSEYMDKIVFVHDSFANIRRILESLNTCQINGMLLDLGVSSFQLDEAERGFSYMSDGPLDMRMDKSKAFTAEDVVNTYSREELTKIIYSYAEEKWAARIAEFIVREREILRIDTTFRLVEIIKKAIPKKARMDGPHPAKRTFQAIRIEVNSELEILERTILDIVDMMADKSRLAVITFHSLEDRIVKETFKSLAAGCVCPREIPVCVCQNVPKVRIITKKPILPDECEIESNPRARSAKLRVIERMR